MKQTPAIATIDDIAAQANLSRSSVAKILRGRPGYNEKTCQRVMKIAKKLNYRPNHLSKALAGGKSMTIGLLVPSLNVPITLAKVREVEHVANQAGYLTYLVTSSIDDETQWVRCLNNLVDRRVDGLLIYASVRLPSAMREALAKLPTPAVVLGHPEPNMPHAVQVDRRPGVEQLADHLARLGHRQAAIFCSPSSLAHAELKYSLYWDAFERVGIAIDRSSPTQLDPAMGLKAHSYQLVSRLVRQQNRPTVLVMNNDDCAHAAIAACVDAGLRVPEDISVTGFDDLPHVQYLRPALTTIHQPREEVGIAGVRMLLKLMQNADAPAEPVVFPCHLVVRQTTGPARPVTSQPRVS